MKRFLCVMVTVLVCALVCMPMSVCAMIYSPTDTDLTLSIDDSVWYVFTRDNIEDNPELDELGLTYDYMYDTLYNNDAYVDAALFYDNGEYVELFVRKKRLDDGIVNLSNYSDSDVLKLATELAKRQGAEDFSVYENSYKFAKAEYFDTNANYYICEYITVVNKDNYTFTFQSPTPFDDAAYAQMKSIVDSVKFRVNPSLKEPQIGFDWDAVWIKALGGAVAGGAAGGVGALINKKRKCRQQAAQQMPQQPIEPPTDTE